jgi:hypothetical protein
MRSSWIALSVRASAGHREVNHAIFDFAAGKSLTSNTLTLGSMFVQVGESFVLGPESRLEPAHLSKWTDGQRKGNSLAVDCLGLGSNSQALGHLSAFLDDC